MTVHVNRRALEPPPAISVTIDGDGPVTSAHVPRLVMYQGGQVRFGYATHSIDDTRDGWSAPFKPHELREFCQSVIAMLDRRIPPEGRF